MKSTSFLHDPSGKRRFFLFSPVTIPLIAQIAKLKALVKHDGLEFPAGRAHIAKAIQDLPTTEVQTARETELSDKVARLEAKLQDWETCHAYQVEEATKLQETLLAIRVLHAEGTDEAKAYLAKNIASLPYDLRGDMAWSWPSDTVPYLELCGE